VQRHKREIKAKKYPQLHKRWHLWCAKIYQRVQNKFHSSTTKLESQNFHRKDKFFCEEKPKSWSTRSNKQQHRFFSFLGECFQNVDFFKECNPPFCGFFKECKAKFYLLPVDSSRVQTQVSSSSCGFFKSISNKLLLLLPSQIASQHLCAPTKLRKTAESFATHDGSIGEAFHLRNFCGSKNPSRNLSWNCPSPPQAEKFRTEKVLQREWRTRRRRGVKKKGLSAATDVTTSVTVQWMKSVQSNNHYGVSFSSG